MRVLLQRLAALQSLSLATILQAADPLSGRAASRVVIRAGGTGIGLPRCPCLIEWYQGHCDADSGVEYQHTSFVALKSGRLSDVHTIGIVGRGRGLCSVAFRPGHCTDPLTALLRPGVLLTSVRGPECRIWSDSPSGSQCSQLVAILHQHILRKPLDSGLNTKQSVQQLTH